MLHDDIIVELGFEELDHLFRDGGEGFLFAHHFEEGHDLAVVVEFKQRFDAEHGAHRRFQPAQPAAAVEGVEVLDDEEVVIVHPLRFQLVGDGVE